jgi:hypothetical protein
MTYEWKVDLALMVAAASLVTSVLSGIAQRRDRRKTERLAAYDDVIQDVCHILEFPMKANDKLVADRLYENRGDPELQAAVRTYLTSHWMQQWLGVERLAPRRLITRIDRLQYVQKVQAAASEFRAAQWDQRMSLDHFERSPVSHLEDPEIARRFERVMRLLGRRLSACSQVVREHWNRAKSTEVAETRGEYERALLVCPNYFEHNDRDFADPFYDLLSRVRHEHRQLNRTPREVFAGWNWSVRRRWSRLLRAISAGHIV